MMRIAELALGHNRVRKLQKLLKLTWTEKVLLKILSNVRSVQIKIKLKVTVIFYFGKFYQAVLRKSFIK